MKIRSGFVSNSSSSSFILIADTKDAPNAQALLKRCKLNIMRDKEHYEYSEKIHEYFNDVPELISKSNPSPRVVLKVNMSSNISYCRDDIMVLKTLEDKIKYVYALYCLWLTFPEDLHADDYFKKAITIGEKLERLCDKYGYCLYINVAPLCAYNEYNTPYSHKELHYYVNITTECTYVDDIAKMLENEDTSELESFIFNPKSFCVLGGDEYDETFELEKREKEKIKKCPYSYHRYADYPDHNKGDSYINYEGKEVTYEDDYHWGECEPDDL
jgi:hypothetical protein